MKDQVLQILAQAGKPLSASQLEARLGIRTSRQSGQLSRQLEKLEKSGKIRKEGNVFLLSDAPRNSVDGIIRLTRAGNGFIDLDSGDSIFIPAEDTGSAMDRDEVRVYCRQGSDGRMEGSVSQILSHSRHYISGSVKKKRGKFQFFPDDPDIWQEVQLTNAPSFPLRSNLKVTGKIVSYGDPLRLEITQILGNEGDPGVDVSAILADYEVFPAFPQEAHDQASRIPSRVTEKEKEGRRDLTGVVHVTIDGEDAKDFDDAVSLSREKDGSCRLYVSIADVSHYVLPNSPIDQEAFARGTSVYVVDRVVPMLPEELCNNICSLLPGEIRLTNTCEMKISPDGDILSYALYPSYIRSYRRMTYTEVNAILEGDPKAAEECPSLQEMLFRMNECAQKIRARREKAGAIDFDVPEAQFTLDEEGRILSIRPRQRKAAEKLIEDFMIEANICVAHQLHAGKIPAVYRVHDKPSLKKMTEFIRLCDSLKEDWPYGTENLSPGEFRAFLEKVKEHPTYPVLSTMMLRSMAKAAYSPECTGHFGLALEEYCHFTSPIRRYPDLVVHRMIRKYVYQRGSADSSPDRAFAQKAAEQSSEKERNADAVEMAVEDYKKAEYMESRVGESYAGQITSVTAGGFYVRLESTVEGFVKISSLKDDFYIFHSPDYTLEGASHHRTYRIGDKVRVVCVSASRALREVQFELAEFRQESSRRKGAHVRKRRRA